MAARLTSRKYSLTQRRSAAPPGMDTPAARAADIPHRSARARDVSRLHWWNAVPHSPPIYPPQGLLAHGRRSAASLRCGRPPAPPAFVAGSSLRRVGPLPPLRSSAPLLAEARTLPNLVLHGAVPRERMAAMYGGAALLLCTSRYEGFPNTFIEAWSLGIPVVSTIDPDGLIAEVSGSGRITGVLQRADGPIASMLPAAQYAEIPRAGHASFISHTDEFLGLLRPFLQTQGVVP